MDSSHDARVDAQTPDGDASEGRQQTLREQLEEIQRVFGYPIDQLKFNDARLYEEAAQEYGVQKAEFNEQRRRKKEEEEAAAKAVLEAEEKAVLEAEEKVALEATEQRAGLKRLQKRKISDSSQSATNRQDPKDRRTRKLNSRRAKEQSASATGATASDAIILISSDDAPSPAATFVAADEPEDAYDIPEWYSSIQPTGHRIKNLAKAKGRTKEVLAALGSMKDCIERCEKNPTVRNFNDLRDHVHKAEFLPDVNEYILFKAHMLDNGLKRIFLGASFPWDLREDAQQLWHRWCSRNFDVDLLRGLISRKVTSGKGTGDKRTADRIDPAWRAENNITAKFYGQGDFVLGQWWPNQISCVRDGVHGAPQAGIFGEKDKGAYSIVLSGGNHYGDIDNGDEIWYSGTEGAESHGSESQVTEDTQRLIESSFAVRNPVRVLRSWNLAKKNKFRPQRGFRYDGLYHIVEHELVDPAKAMYRFRFRRDPGQHPIRYESGPSCRPTKYEIEAYDKQVAIRKYERGESK